MLGINKLGGAGSRFKQVSAATCAARVTCIENTAETAKVRIELTPFQLRFPTTINVLGKMENFCRASPLGITVSIQDGDLESCGTGTQGVVGGRSPGELLASCALNEPTSDARRSDATLAINLLLDLGARLRAGIGSKWSLCFRSMNRPFAWEVAVEVGIALGPSNHWRAGPHWSMCSRESPDLAHFEIRGETPASLGTGAYAPSSSIHYLVPSSRFVLQTNANE